MNTAKLRAESLDTSNSQEVPDAVQNSKIAIDNADGTELNKQTALLNEGKSK